MSTTLPRKTSKNYPKPQSQSFQTWDTTKFISLDSTLATTYDCPLALIVCPSVSSYLNCPAELHIQNVSVCLDLVTHPAEGFHTRSRPVSQLSVFPPLATVGFLLQSMLTSSVKMGKKHYPSVLCEEQPTAQVSGEKTVSTQYDREGFEQTLFSRPSNHNDSASDQSILSYYSLLFLPWLWHAFGLPKQSAPPKQQWCSSSLLLISPYRIT